MNVEESESLQEAEHPSEETSAAADMNQSSNGTGVDVGEVDLDTTIAVADAGEILAEEGALTPGVSDRLEEALESVTDPDKAERLRGIYRDIVGLEHTIEEVKHDAVEEIAEVSGVPALLLEKAQGVHGSGLQAVLEERHELTEGRELFKRFAEEAKGAHNLFYINQSLDAEQLRQRMTLLGELQSLYEKTHLKDRTEMKESLLEMFGIPDISEGAQKYLDDISSYEDTVHSEGAENKNLIFLINETRAEVLKITKGRHDVDFTSMIKLMYNMHAIALRFNHEDPGAENIEVNLSFNDMMVYKDADGNLKRMVRQDYAPGETLKEMSPAKKENPEFREAFRAFLRKVETMKETDGVVLDISDSAAGFKEKRGDVLNSGNVFVRFPDGEENEKYVFTIIDPDVFDTAPGIHKFDGWEQIRHSGLKGALQALKVAATNTARDSVVSRWQNGYTKKYLQEGE